MSRAEEIHYKAVMAADNQEPPKDYAISAHADHFNGFVEGYIEGYHQAEKDLELSWEDIREIYSILLNVQEETNDDYLLTLSIPERIENEYREYKETLKRYFEWKSNKTVQQRVKEEAE